MGTQEELGNGVKWYVIKKRGMKDWTPVKMRPSDARRLGIQYTFRGPFDTKALLLTRVGIWAGE